VGRFHAAHPGVSIAVSEQGSTHLLKGLASGELDLALAVLPVHAPGTERTVLAIEELVVAIRSDHPLAARHRIGIPDLADVPMVMFRDGYDLRTTTLAAFGEAGLTPRIAVEGGEMGSVVSLAAEGLGAAIIPSIVSISDTRLHVLRLERPCLNREIALISRSDRRLSNAASALATEIAGSLDRHGWPHPVPPGLRLCP
jgi:DNA-binding transcriptional LysR family regulator